MISYQSLLLSTIVLNDITKHVERLVKIAMVEFKLMKHSNMITLCMCVQCLYVIISTSDHCITHRHTKASVICHGLHDPRLNWNEKLCYLKPRIEECLRNVFFMHVILAMICTLFMTEMEEE